MTIRDVSTPAKILEAVEYIAREMVMPIYEDLRRCIDRMDTGLKDIADFHSRAIYEKDRRIKDLEAELGRLSLRREATKD